jgi:ATP-dependent Clp protease ATP-binding subunit ClpA
MLGERLIGQEAAIGAIVPYVQMFRSGLSPEGRPAGVFLLLGPTGTGKTRTVEALAAVLHGSDRSLLRVDCGEFQMEHEVAKLIGAPPGYLGHRETPPMLTQQKLSSVTSESCGLSIVLFDEIEKAAASMTRLLLGVLDKAILRLGDNSQVNFERSMIFLTSNAGADRMTRHLSAAFGFAQAAVHPPESRAGEPDRQLESIAMGAVKRKFTPEFVNRIDSVVTYRPLSPAALDRILDLELQVMQEHVQRRLADHALQIIVPRRTRHALLERGTSLLYGARELKRLLHRCLLQPLAAKVAEGSIPQGAVLTLGVEGDGFRLEARRKAA